MYRFPSVSTFGTTHSSHPHHHRSQSRTPTSNAIRTFASFACCLAAPSIPLPMLSRRHARGVLVPSSPRKPAPVPSSALARALWDFSLRALTIVLGVSATQVGPTREEEDLKRRAKARSLVLARRLRKTRELVDAERLHGALVQRQLRAANLTLEAARVPRPSLCRHRRTVRFAVES